MTRLVGEVVVVSIGNLVRFVGAEGAGLLSVLVDESRGLRNCRKRRLDQKNLVAIAMPECLLIPPN